MLKLFEICFWTGAIFTIVTFAIGQIGDFMDIGSDVDFHGSLDGLNISPLKPVVLTAFTTVFGGVGIILYKKGLTGLVSLIVAMFAALLTAFLIFRFIIVPLYKAENTSTVSQEVLIGHRAKVKLSIKKDSFGEITYEINGNLYAAPSRAIDGIDINKGEEVTIVKIEKNVFYVAKL